MTFPVLTHDEPVTCDPSLTPHLGDVETDHFAAVFKAISHPVRLRMLDLISQGGGRVCGCDIERHFELTQPTISHHLKVLRDAGLIHSEPRGVWVMYQINRPLLASLQGVLMVLNNSGR